jgi:hypothetical protein
MSAKNQDIEVDMTQEANQKIQEVWHYKAFGSTEFESPNRPSCKRNSSVNLLKIGVRVLWNTRKVCAKLGRNHMESCYAIRDSK